MPAERIEIPPEILSWYRMQRARGRDWCVHLTGLATRTIQTIDETGLASPAVIGRLRDARDQDPAYRRRVSYRHAVETLRHLVNTHPSLQRGDGLREDSRDRIIAALGLDVLDEMAVKADLLPPAD